MVNKYYGRFSGYYSVIRRTKELWDTTTSLTVNYGIGKLTRVFPDGNCRPYCLLHDELV